MTQPPGDPNDPNQQPPHTRAFDPDQNPAEYPERPLAYTESQAYGATYPEEPGYDAEPPTGTGPASGGGGGRRTLLLSAAAVVALVLIIVLATLIVKGSGGDDGGGAAAASDTASASTTPSTTTRTTTTTTEETTTTTTPTVTPGSVVYQLTGSGDVVALRIRSGSDAVVIAATGSPWSQSTIIDGTDALLTAIVVRGPVTCTIMQGGELLSSATSSGGALRCGAKLPH